LPVSQDERALEEEIGAVSGDPVAAGAAVTRRRRGGADAIRVA